MDLFILLFMPLCADTVLSISATRLCGIIFFSLRRTFLLERSVAGSSARTTLSMHAPRTDNASRQAAPCRVKTSPCKACIYVDEGQGDVAEHCKMRKPRSYGGKQSIFESEQTFD